MEFPSTQGSVLSVELDPGIWTTLKWVRPGARRPAETEYSIDRVWVATEIESVVQRLGRVQHRLLLDMGPRPAEQGRLLFEPDEDAPEEVPHRRGRRRT